MNGSLSHFFANHVVATIGVIVVVFFMFTRGGGAGILGSWIVRIVVMVMLAVWIWIALMSYLDSLANKAERYADEVQQEASSHIPQWMKDPWESIKFYLPFLGDVSLNKICKKLGLGSICGAGGVDGGFLDQVTADRKKLEEICRSSPAVKAKLGENNAILYCNGNVGVEAQKAIKAATADQLLNSIGPLSTLLVAKGPHVLDQQPYLNCLLTAANTLPGVDARSCKYSDPHMWRLCVEFHIQLARSDPLHPNPPMSPRIIDCRKSALDLH
ncbi:MAG: hypothetical protein DYH20_12180 [Gammaproteobacteria bacterium PRO9]|nr:hypothetical protein [Gammaproteobacteria bacterium PRO9]